MIQSRALNARRFNVFDGVGDKVVKTLADSKGLFGWFGDPAERAAKALAAMNIGETRIVTEALDYTDATYWFTRLPDPTLRPLPRRRTKGSCGCCGAGGDEPVFVANVRDADGTYYARLCDDCFDDFEAQGDFDRNDASLAIVSDLLGDDLDGIQTILEDACA